MKNQDYNTKLVSFFTKNKNASEYLKDYSIYLKKLLEELDYHVIEDVLNCLLRARENSSTIFFAGNGGSAATATHFSQDLSEISRKTGKKGFKCVSLNDNAPSITALANDYGYENIFSGQLEEIFTKNDLLVVISASGNSPNIINAVEFAKKVQGTTIGLVGFDGGRLSKLCDYVIHVPTNKYEYGPVEDLHLVIAHMLTSYILCRDSI